MNLLHLSGTTAADGTVSLRIPLGQPSTEFELVVVAQPKQQAAQPVPGPDTDPWAGADMIRERLRATGKVFSDSVELIREDRNR